MGWLPQMREEEQRGGWRNHAKAEALFARSIALLVGMEGGREPREPWEALIRFLDARS
jgi:hypothetical protein